MQKDDPYFGIGAEDEAAGSIAQVGAGDPYAGIGVEDSAVVQATAADPYSGIGIESTDPSRAGESPSSGVPLPRPDSQRGTPIMQASTHPGDVAYMDARQKRIADEARKKVASEGAVEAGAREAAFGAAPALAGIGTGAAIGTAFAPGIGTAIGAIGGGIAAAMGANWLQNKAIEAVAHEQAERWQAERAAAAEAHPVATVVGSLIPQLIALKPSTTNVAAAAKGAKMLLTGELQKIAGTPSGQHLINQMFNVGIGAAIPGAQEAYEQYKAGDFTAARMAAQVIGGALINEPNKFGVKLGLVPSTAEPKPAADQSAVAVAPKPTRTWDADTRTQHEADVARLNDEMAKLGLGETATLSDKWTQEMAAADELGRRVGRRVVFVEGLKNRNGVNLKDDPSVVFVNAGGNDPVFFVTAHEIKHQIDANHPDVAERLDAVIGEHLASKPKQSDRPETYADAFAEVVSDKGFWERLARQDQTLFQRVYEVVRAVIENITSSLPPEYRVQFARKDSFFKVQEAAAQAYREVAGRAADPNYRPPWMAEPFSMTKGEVAARNAEARLNQRAAPPQPSDVVPVMVGDSAQEGASLGRVVMPESVATSERLQRTLFDATGKPIEAAPRTTPEDANAIREPIATEILPREPAQVGEAGSERVGMGQVEQGSQTAEAVPVKPVEPASGVEAEVPKAVDQAKQPMDQSKADNPLFAAKTPEPKAPAAIPKTVKQIASRYPNVRDAEAIAADAYANFIAKMGPEAKGYATAVNNAMRDAWRKQQRDDARFASLDADTAPVVKAAESVANDIMRNEAEAERSALVSTAMQRPVTAPAGARSDVPYRMADTIRQNFQEFAELNAAKRVGADSRTKAARRGETESISLTKQEVADWFNAKNPDAPITKQNAQDHLNAAIAILREHMGGNLQSSMRRHKWVSDDPVVQAAVAKIHAGDDATALKFSRGKTWRQIKDWLGMHFVSWESPHESRLAGSDAPAEAIERGRRIMSLFHGIRGASGRAGETMDGIADKLRGAGLRNQADLDALNIYREAQRTIEADAAHRAKVERDNSAIRNDENWTPEDEAAYQDELANFKSRLTVDEARRIVDSARNQPNWRTIEAADSIVQEQFDANLKLLHDNGLVSDAAYTWLREHHKHYQPRLFLDKIDPVRTYENGHGGKVAVHESGIRSLAGGSDTHMVSDTMYLLALNTQRAESIVAKNKANLALAELIGTGTAHADYKPMASASAKPPDGYTPVYYMENGQRKAFAIKSEIADNWKLSDPAVNAEMAKWLRWGTGTAGVKFFATSGNPEFAVANILRDIGYNWIAGKQYSTFLPQALGQVARNIGKQITNKAVYRTLRENYVRYGGSTEYLSTAGHLSDLHNPGAVTEGRRAVNKVMTFLGWLGSKSEEANRLAHMQQALRNMGHKVGEAGWEQGVSPQEWLFATHEASNVLDFRQGGNWIKALDNVIPFIGAGTQGARGITRAFKDRPYDTSMKAAQLVAVGAYIAWLNRQNNPKAAESISERERDTGINIALPGSRKDANGDERFGYVRLPVDQAWRPFMVLGEMLANREAGGKVDVSRLRRVISQNFSPVEINNLPPVIAAMLTYTQNHDFWRNEDVWKGRPVMPAAERLPSTPKSYQAIGDVTGASPARLQAAKRVLVPDNPIEWGVDRAVDFFGTPNDAKVQEDRLVDASRMPFARKTLRFTSPRQLTREDITKARKMGVKTQDRSAAAILDESKQKQLGLDTEKQKNDYRFDSLAAQVKSGAKSRADLMREIYRIKDAGGKPSLSEMKRIRNRLHNRYPELHIPGASAT